MPVPGGELEAKGLRRTEMTGHQGGEAKSQEDRADDHMRAVETGRHEEGGAVNVAAVMKASVRIFIGLHAGEGEAKQDSEHEAPFQPLSVALQQRMMRPSHRGAGGEQNQRVE